MNKINASTSLSVRVWVGQAELVKQAATVAGLSVPDYVRGRLVAAAAADLNVTEPNYPQFARRGPVSNVTKAANAIGLTVAQFRKMALENAAASIVKSMGAVGRELFAVQGGTGGSAGVHSPAGR